MTGEDAMSRSISLATKSRRGMSEISWIMVGLSHNEIYFIAKFSWYLNYLQYLPVVAESCLK